LFKLLKRAIGLSLLWSVAQAANAQDFYQVEMRPVRGFMPNMDQLSSPIDHIDPVSRKIHLEIPLASLPKGRAGTGFDLGLVYDSDYWDLVPEAIPATYPWDQNPNTPPAVGYRLDVRYGTRAGWAFNFEQIMLDLEERVPPEGVTFDCNVNFTYSRYRLHLRLLDGSDHILQMNDTPPQGYVGDGFYPVDPSGRCWDGAASAQFASGWRTYYTTDGSYIKVMTYAPPGGPSSWSLQDVYVYFPDGRRLVIDGYPSGKKHLYDANGNGVHIGNFCADPPACNDLYYGIVDDAGLANPGLGREIRISASNDGLTTTVTAPGPNGLMTWTLNWEAFQLGLDGRTYAVKSPFDGSPWGDDYLLGLNTVLTGLKYVQLPLELPVPVSETPPVWNSYAIGYADDADDGYGQVDSVRTPTGAVFQYRYDLEGGTPGSYNIVHDTKVHERRISYDGGPDLVWTYTNGSAPVGGAAIVTNPDSTQTTYWYGAASGVGSTLGGYLDSSIPGNLASGAVIYRIDEPNGKVTKRMWSQNRAPNGSPYSGNNAFVRRETVTVGDKFGVPSLTSVTDRIVDKNGNVLQSTDYEWVGYDGSGPESGVVAKRTTQLTYHAVVSDYTSMNSIDMAYWKPHFSPLAETDPRRLDAVRRKETRDGANAIAAVSEFDYDDPYGSGNLTANKNWDSEKSSSAPGLGSLNSSNSQVLARSYDSYGNLENIYAPEVATHVAYDPSGSYPTLVQYAVGTSEQRSWSYLWNTAAGTLISKTDEDNQIATVYEYDNVGRQTKVIEAGIRQTFTKYEDPIRTVKVFKDLVTLDDKKLGIVTEYDALGRVALVTTTEPGNPGGIKVKTTYHPTLNRTVQSSSYRTLSDVTLEWTCTQKDALQRITKIAVFKGAVEPTDCDSPTDRTGIAQTIYDSNWTSFFDPAVKHRAERRDSLGRLVEVVEDPGGAGHFDYHTTYDYDTLGNLTEVLQGAQTRTFEYSSLARLTSASNPESGETEYTYTDSGDLWTRKDARGKEVTLTYDALHRILTKSYNDTTPPVAYSYYLSGAGSSRVGQLQTVSSAVATTQNDTYDSMGRVTSSSHSIAGDSETRSFSYAYWLNNSIQSITNPSGRVIHYDIDDAARTMKIWSGATTYADMTVSGAAYTADNRISEMKLGNDLWETRLYATPGSATLFKVGTTQGTSDILELEYNFDGAANNGNLQSHVIRHSGKQWTQTYGYDDVNRLKSAIEDDRVDSSGWSNHYEYDRFGNRWVSSKSGLEFDDTHEPTASTDFLSNNRINVAGSDFDLAGNQIKFAPFDLKYDAESRNYEVTSSTNGGVFFAYDGDGRRVKKSWTPYGGSPTTTYYYYNAFGQLAAEYSTTPSTVSTTYVHTDMLGSTRMVTSAAGTILECYDYLPFGRMLSDGVNGRDAGCYPPNPDSEINSNLPQKFTGKERDSETRLDYFGARYYSGAQGRFISADAPFADQHPENPQSWNLYGYVRNNPLTNIDVDGHKTESWLDRITEYLGSLWRSTVGVGLKSFQDPAPPSKPEPELMGLNGDKIVLKHAETLGKELDAVATGVELLDPTGLASVARSSLEGDPEGVVIAMAGAALGGGKGRLTYGEAKSLVGKWGTGTFDTIAEMVQHSFEGHAGQVGAKDVWQFLRKSANFNKSGASSKVLEDGRKRWIRKSGEFLIEDENGKIVSYGMNLED
jgi:RHS repeat-associated protein